MIPHVPDEVCIDQGYEIIKPLKFQPREQMRIQRSPKGIISVEKFIYKQKFQGKPNFNALNQT